MMMMKVISIMTIISVSLIDSRLSNMEDDCVGGWRIIAGVNELRIMLRCIAGVSSGLNVLGTVISGYGVRGTEEEECSCGCSGREPQTEEEVEEEETEFGPDKEEMEMLL